jgi:hypothetical protein
MLSRAQFNSTRSTEWNLRLSRWLKALDRFGAISCQGRMDCHLRNYYQVVTDHYTVSCQDYSLSVTDKWTSIKHWCTMVKGKLYSDKNLSHCNSAHHKSQLPAWDWTWESARWGHWIAASSIRSWRYTDIRWCQQRHSAGSASDLQPLQASVISLHHTSLQSSTEDCKLLTQMFRRPPINMSYLQTFESSIPGGGSLQCSRVCSGEIVRLPLQYRHWALPCTVHSLYIWCSIAK